jgi:LmbE family N-acetylglucosaminyl deacetylase
MNCLDALMGDSSNLATQRGLRGHKVGHIGNVALTTVDSNHLGTSPLAWNPVVLTMEPWPVSAELHSRLVVVSPHPDDETLGVGGLIAETARLGVRILVVSVTDGEAAATTKAGLAERRHTEMRNALNHLVPQGSLQVVRYRLPDGQVERMQNQLEKLLTAEVRPTDLVVAPLSCDGHSDHDAIGHVSRRVASDAAASFGSYPIWAWHWHDPRQSVISSHGRRIGLSDEAWQAKVRAIGCFPSQTSGSVPVLPEHFLRRFAQPYEVIVDLD